MPKQIGLIKIKGKLGDTSFYKSKDGYLVRDKGGVDGSRIKTDPKFKRTRENMSEFGRSATAASGLRKLLAPVIEKIRDGRMHNRLVTAMRACMDADVTNKRGDRNLVDGDITLLNGFDFNGGSTLVSTFFGSFNAVMTRVSGEAVIHIDAFDPDDFLVLPASSTHFRFVMGALEWDVENNTGNLAMERSAYFPANDPLLPQTLQAQLTANSTLPVVFVLGVEFAQQINSSNYTLSDSSYVSARIVKVDE